MHSFGDQAEQMARIYFTGGATAVLLGWRSSTIDIDLQIVPEHDHLLRAIPEFKEKLELNIELACPAHFIPELPDWEDRSRFIAQEGSLFFYHYDLYAQALSKIERAHTQDLADVKELLNRGFIAPGRLRELFEQIFPNLYRFPAIDPDSFRQALNNALTEFEAEG
ncbi:MAG: hypothetical protein L0387_35990 [Acidobacteria bacterium]|nr:hypothetical protein [Acidobacteriota bacterium]MCI0626993.1 hypothetical protein [Acidobacteriota bacterium]MCI0724994.1 hypothetical protein [Acidobacteriota bacterium]